MKVTTIQSEQAFIPCQRGFSEAVSRDLLSAGGLERVVIICGTP